VKINNKCREIIETTIFLGVFLGYAARFCPMRGPGTGVIGIVVGLVAVSCCVGILSHP
jgi:hypothetical protein